ncbi:MAG: PQQ-dependent sugar dehydrogenase [Phycisphaerales bacterium]|nr:PQQ-dependent sugar dehydrogenase [Phycisphaerales bacterium]
MKHTAVAFLALAALSATGLAQSIVPGTEKKPLEKITDPKAYTAADGTRYTVQTVAEKLEVPWAMAFASDGRCFFTERKGRVRIIGADGKLVEKPAMTLPNVAGGGEVGLMGICLHPDFDKNHFVYLAYGDKSAKDIRIIRCTEKDGVLTREKDILTGIEIGGNHAGCGIRFGPDKKLYISTGEHFQKELAQMMDKTNGKILRLNDDGTVPDDNPFAGANKKPGTRPEIWTLGNRNPQGFDWHPTTGLMYETEHGPSGEVIDGVGSRAADEFNLIEKGKNYGWPVIWGDGRHDGMESPLKQWTPGIAPSGGAFVKSEKMFPQWVGNYMVGGLGGLQRDPIPGVYMVKLATDGRSVASIDRLVPDMGRIRAVAQAPDGSVWFSTSNKDGRGRSGDKLLDDQICRIVPVK